MKTPTTRRAAEPAFTWSVCVKTHTSSSGRERPTYIMQRPEEVNLSALSFSADSSSDMTLIPAYSHSRDGCCQREPSQEGLCSGWAPNSEGKWDRGIFMKDGAVRARWREWEAAVRERSVSAATSAHLSRQADADTICGRGRKESARSPVGPTGGISSLSAKPRRRLKERRGAALACARAPPLCALRKRSSRSMVNHRPRTVSRKVKVVKSDQINSYSQSSLLTYEEKKSMAS